MAKQIYIDENGNPIEVSGTINNASMLPISANDSTDTKTYIDSATNDIYHVQSNSSNPAIIDNVEAYASMLLIGFAQGIGGVMIALRVHNGSVANAKDLLNLNAFSNANVTFAYDSQTKEFSIITTSASYSKFTVILTNA